MSSSVSSFLVYGKRAGQLTDKARGPVNVGIIAAFAVPIDLVDAASVGAALEMLALFPAALVLPKLVDAGGGTASSLLGLLWLLVGRD